MRTRFSIISGFIGCILVSFVHAKTLTEFSFDVDDWSLETGPDTFSVFQNSKGRVALSDAFHFSGYRSIEIKDVAGDQNFPELQGYFPVQNQGRIFVHFALLVATPEESFNIALAGPSWFTFEKNGIAIWLSSNKGLLQLKSARGNHSLFQIRGFTWYRFDIVYSIAEGAFDLKISEEYDRAPQVDLHRIRSANESRNSSVDKFSFIGDHPQVGKIPAYDESNVVYYVDDISISNEEPGEKPEDFVAPGRRRLFVDAWNQDRLKRAGKLSCPSAMSMNDFGIRADDLPRIKENGWHKTLEGLLRHNGSAGRLADYPGYFRDIFHSIELWNSGCDDLEARKFEDALKKFEEARGFQPDSPLYLLSSLSALAELDSWDRIESIVLRNSGSIDWGIDLRFDEWMMRLSLRKNNPWVTNQSLTRTVEILRTEFDTEDIMLLWKKDQSASAPALKKKYGDRANRILRLPWMTLLKYYSLLANQKYEEAASYSAEVIEFLREKNAWSAEWRFHRGDALFYLGRWQEAKDEYQQVVSRPGKYLREASERMADIYFKSGDAKSEKAWREKIYGSMLRSN